jgi:23S rRNA pseudouridine2605 synthase
MEERLQKIMSHAGLGSRRACEELIVDGRVTVNGKVAVIGQKADPVTDRIVVDGRVIAGAEAPIYIALHKPRNVLSTVEAESHDFRKTVRDLVPVEGRIYPVGRLDFDSEGLVLMTNDGDLANKLTHPRFGHLKIYRVLVARRPDDEQLATWRRGVVLEDGYKTAPADVTLEGSSGKGAWLRVVMREGRKRQIREIGSLLGLPVVRILRIAIGSLRLGTLKRGEWRYLSDEEVAELKGQGPARMRKSPRVADRSQRTRRPDAGGGRADVKPRRSPRPDEGGGRADVKPRRSPRPGAGEAGRSPARPARPAPGASRPVSSRRPPRKK